METNLPHASPAIITKLRNVGDTRGAEILEIILRDEIGHVRVGNRWYEYFCARRRPRCGIPEIVEGIWRVQTTPAVAHKSQAGRGV